MTNFAAPAFCRHWSLTPAVSDTSTTPAVLLLLNRDAPPSHTVTDEHRTVGILHITKTSSWGHLGATRVHTRNGGSLFNDAVSNPFVT